MSDMDIELVGGGGGGVFLPIAKPKKTAIGTLLRVEVIAGHVFQDIKTGEDYTKPAVKLYFGYVVDGEPQVVSTFPIVASMGAASRVGKIMAAFGIELKAGDTTAAYRKAVGKPISFSVIEKVGQKKTVYGALDAKSIAPLPEIEDADGNLIDLSSRVPKLSLFKEILDAYDAAREAGGYPTSEDTSTEATKTTLAKKVKLPKANLADSGEVLDVEDF